MLLSSTSFGHCEIHSLLSVGGVGDVYLLHDMRLDGRSALKVLPTDLINDHMRLRRLEREARVASTLDHPNMINIQEIGGYGKRHFIAAERITHKNS